MAGKQGDTITGSSGPVNLRDEPLDTKSGDAITTSVAGVAQTPEVYAGKVSGEGDRDWTDVNNRVVQVSGVHVSNFGDITYTETGDISDEDEAKIDAQFEKAGAEAGAGRRVVQAVRQMGYGIKFTARKAPEPSA